MEVWWALAAGGTAGAAAAGMAARGLREAARLVVEHLVFEVRPGGGSPVLVLLSRRRVGPGEPLARPPGSGCFRLAHLTDLHLHRSPGPSHRLAAQAVAAAAPDAVAITGDFVDRFSRSAAVAPYLARLARLAPAVAVLGNHDLERPRLTEFVSACLSGAGITLLFNRRVLARAPGLQVELVGVGSPDLRLDDLDLALSRPPVPWPPGAVPGQAARPDPVASAPTVRVTLAHSYHVLEHEPPQRCGALVLVGDTHGGQVVLPGLGPVWARWVHRHRYVEGVYRVGTTWLYVNRGVGTIGPPLRLRCPPEVAVVDLCPAVTP